MMISGDCVELLEGFGAEPIYPEINALQLAIRHQSLDPILVAEDMGYAADNCAYVKADIGCYVKGTTPTGGRMPTPTLILSNFVGCNTYLKGFTDKLPEKFRAEALAETVTGRLVETTDIASAVLFLCGDGGRRITGQILRVDSGQVV